MNTKRFCTAAAAVTLVAMALTATYHLVAAEQPELKLRTFMILTLPEDFPDIEDVSSRFLVTHAGERSNGSITVRPAALTGDCSPLFPARTWYIGGYVTHVTSDGPQTFFVYWLDEVPPEGAFALTGPEGEALAEELWVRAQSSGECFEDGDWIIQDADNGGFLRYVVTGWFSK